MVAGLSCAPAGFTLLEPMEGIQKRPRDSGQCMLKLIFSDIEKGIIWFYFTNVKKQALYKYTSIKVSLEDLQFYLSKLGEKSFPSENAQTMNPLNEGQQEN